MEQKVLLISNSGNVIKRISAFLAEVGYRVVIQDNAQSAIRFVANEKPTLILCQFQMDGITGIELGRLFKSRPTLQAIPFILLGMSREQWAMVHEMGLNIPCDDVIFAPFTQADLYGVVSKWAEIGGVPAAVVPAAAPSQPAVQPTVTIDHEHRGWARGRVTPISMSMLLGHVLRMGSEGVLRVRQERRKLKATVASGRLVDVESNYLRNDSLGALLVEQHIITPAENERTFIEAQKQKVPQGEVLVEMRIISAKELEHHIRLQKFHKFSNLFGADWFEAEFDFRVEKIHATPEISVDRPLIEAIRLGLEVKASPSALWNAVVFHHKAEHYVFPSLKFDAVTRALGFGAADAQQIRESMGRSFHSMKSEPILMRRILAMLALKGVELRGPDQAGVSKPAPTPVAEQTKTQPTHDVFPERREGEPRDFVEAMAGAQALIRDGEFRPAQGHVSRALRINPDHPVALAAHAWCTYNVQAKGAPTAVEHCKDVLKRAISLDAQNDQAMCYLGKILLDEGKNSLALIQFEKAYKINPNNLLAERESRLHQMKVRKQKSLNLRS